MNIIKRPDPQNLVVVNALVFLLSIPVSQESSIFTVVQIGILVLNLATLLYLFRADSFIRGLFFFFIAILYKPIYLYFPTEGGLAPIHLTVSILLFLLALSVKYPHFNQDVYKDMQDM